MNRNSAHFISPGDCSNEANLIKNNNWSLIVETYYSDSQGFIIQIVILETKKSQFVQISEFRGNVPNQTVVSKVDDIFQVVSIPKYRGNAPLYTTIPSYKDGNFNFARVHN